MSFNRILKLIFFAVFLCGHNCEILADNFPLIRAENVVVPPSTGPNTHIIVKNENSAPLSCNMQFKYPQGWKISPNKVDVIVEAGESKKIPITIDKAIDLKSNSYPVEITIVSGGKQKVYRQDIFAATSPVFTPKINANLKDWKDAVPITFTVKDRKTTIMTGWNKKYFNVAVEVEEDELSGYTGKNDKPFDAVQFAIAPRKSVTPTTEGGKSSRYEFLIVHCPGFLAKDKCFLLMKPGDKISVAVQKRELAPLLLKDAKIAVKHKKKSTIYECSIPMSMMKDLRAMTGRDYLMSFLVHDPDGTGIRDLGQISGLWESQRNKYAWSTWKGVKWAKQPQFDSKLEWGFCTSKY